MDPRAASVSYATTSARMKPRARSEWISPAACCAVVPRGMDHARETRLAQPQIREKRRGIRGVKLGDLELDFSAERHDPDRAAREKCRKAGEVGRTTRIVSHGRHVCLIEIHHEQQGFRRKELE